MKKTTCNALAGACDAEITGATPEEMAENAKKHAIEVMLKGDQAHLDAMQKMKEMSPEDQKKWYEEFKNNFDNLPDA